MRFFVDSADPDEVASILRLGVVSGVTTNPSHMAAVASSSRLETLFQIIAVIREFGTELPLSVQVMTKDPREMLIQAKMLRDALDYSNLVIKVPIGADTLETISQLAADDFAVNCTACMTHVQALMGAAAGARYVSLFCGKIGDVGVDAFAEMRNCARSLAQLNSETEIIIGSIRKPYDVHEIARSDAHIITMRPAWFAKMASHPQTDAAVASFAADFTEWGTARDR